MVFRPTDKGRNAAGIIVEIDESQAALIQLLVDTHGVSYSNAARMGGVKGGAAVTKSLQKYSDWGFELKLYGEGGSRKGKEQDYVGGGYAPDKRLRATGQPQPARGGEVGQVAGSGMSQGVAVAERILSENGTTTVVTETCEGEVSVANGYQQLVDQGVPVLRFDDRLVNPKLETFSPSAHSPSSVAPFSVYPRDNVPPPVLLDPTTYTPQRRAAPPSPDAYASQPIPPPQPPAAAFSLPCHLIVGDLGLSTPDHSFPAPTQQHWTDVLSAPCSSLADRIEVAKKARLDAPQDVLGWESVVCPPALAQEQESDEDDLPPSDQATPSFRAIIPFVKDGDAQALFPPETLVCRKIEKLKAKSGFHLHLYFVGAALHYSLEGAAKAVPALLKTLQNAQAKAIAQNGPGAGTPAVATMKLEEAGLEEDGETVGEKKVSGALWMHTIVYEVAELWKDRDVKAEVEEGVKSGKLSGSMFLASSLFDDDSPLYSLPKGSRAPIGVTRLVPFLFLLNNDLRRYATIFASIGHEIEGGLAGVARAAYSRVVKTGTMSDHDALAPFYTLSITPSSILPSVLQPVCDLFSPPLPLPSVPSEYFALKTRLGSLPVTGTFGIDPDLPVGSSEPGSVAAMPPNHNNWSSEERKKRVATSVVEGTRKKVKYLGSGASRFVWGTLPTPMNDEGKLAMLLLVKVLLASPAGKAFAPGAASPKVVDDHLRSAVLDIPLFPLHLYKKGDNRLNEAALSRFVLNIASVPEIPFPKDGISIYACREFGMPSQFLDRYFKPVFTQLGIPLLSPTLERLHHVERNTDLDSSVFAHSPLLLNRLLSVYIHAIPGLGNPTEFRARSDLLLSLVRLAALPSLPTKEDVDAESVLAAQVAAPELVGLDRRKLINMNKGRLRRMLKSVLGIDIPNRGSTGSKRYFDELDPVRDVDYEGPRTRGVEMSFVALNDEYDDFIEYW